MSYSQSARKWYPLLLVVLLTSSAHVQGREQNDGQAGREVGKEPTPTDTAGPAGSPTGRSAPSEGPSEGPPVQAVPPSASEAAQTAAPSPVPASQAGSCPATLLPYLKQRQQPVVPPVQTGSVVSDTNNATQGDQGKPQEHNEQLAEGIEPIDKLKEEQQPHVPAWPPLALKQGLTCTMEVSQLSVAMPGTQDVCSVFRITNNLLSVLYSWQLEWEPNAAGGLQAVEADGAIVLGDPDSEEPSVRVINAAQSPEIEAQGGTVDFIVQMGLPAEVIAGSNTTNNNSNAVSSRRLRVSPGIAAVYLNGLQCTRLPLIPPNDGRVKGPGGPPDCTATRWPITSKGMFESLGSTTNSSNSSNSSNTTDAMLAAALSWLSCSAHYCCGLQVVTTDNALNIEPSVSALDGPGSQSSNGSEANATQAANASLPANLTASANMNSQLPQPLDSPTPVDSNNSNSSSMAGLIAGIVASVIGAVVVVAVGSTLIVRQRKRLRQQQRLQHLFSHKPAEQVPHLATAALVRASSSGSTDSTGSHPGSVQGSGTLASSSASDWQQQQRQSQVPSSVRGPAWHQHASASPYHSAPASYLQPSGVVWRAGSWQGPDKMPAQMPVPGHPLLRSASSPQALAEQQQLQQLALPAASIALVLASHCRMPSLPSTGPAVPLRNSSTVLRLGSADSSLAGAAVSLVSTSAGPSRLGSSSGAAGGGDFLHRNLSNVSSQSSSIMLPNGKAGLHASAAAVAQTTQAGHSTFAGPSTVGSTWGSLRRFFSSSTKQPQSSGVSPGSSMSTLAAAYAGHSNASTAVTAAAQTAGIKQQQQQLQRQLLSAGQAQHAVYHSSASHCHTSPQLHLIQETAPLADAQLTASTDLLLRQTIGRQHHSRDLRSLTATRGGAGVSNMLLSSVSRRISPILSVYEDGSSATSNDSIAGPAAWHLVERQLLLEETPGWLNIDFAREVRLEKKLGEGGFGQVFRARWRDEVIAAKLVPFMSLAAHTTLPLASVLGDQTPGTPGGTAGNVGGAANSNSSIPPHRQSANDAMTMGVGMQFSAASLRAIKMEIKVLSQLSHPNIVSFKGACLAPPHICILEELAEGGSLYSRLYSCSSKRASASTAAGAPKSLAAAVPKRRRRPIAGAGSSGSARAPPLSVGELLRIAIDVASAMQYLHNMQPQVVHRDLKPQNVLLDLEGRAKVCDFGISKMKDASLAASTTRLQAGTPAYMAPEQFEGCSATEKVDVFAFGVLLWECCEQQQPWRDLSPMQIIYTVGLQKERLKRPSSCTDGLWQLIEACWQQQPERRPRFAKVLATLKQLQQSLDGQQTQQPMMHDTNTPQQQDADPALQQHALGAQKLVPCLARAAAAACKVGVDADALAEVPST